MSGELEALLKMVADGRITAEEAAPIVAALEGRAAEAADSESGNAPGGAQSGARTEVRNRADSTRAGDESRGNRSAQDLLAGRRLRVYVAENGRQLINIQIPLTAAGFAIDQVPGLSYGHRSRIAEAIRNGMTGPILEVSDDGDEVRIVIE